MLFVYAQICKIKVKFKDVFISCKIAFMIVFEVVTVLNKNPSPLNGRWLLDIL